MSAHDSYLDPHAPSPPQSAQSLTFFDMILPPEAAPLLLLLLIIAPLIILTGESLFSPLIDWVQARMTLGADADFEMLPFHFFLKLGAFLLLSFFGAFQLLLRINTIYYTAWSRSFPTPHTLHVDYHPHKYKSMSVLTVWKLYRLMMIIVPPVAVIGLSVLVGLLEMYLFNVFGEFPFISLSIQMTLSIFVMLLLAMLSLFAILSSVWNSFTTLFGDVVAVTEPELSPKTIFDRCNRIAFASPYVYGLYGYYCFFVVLVVGLSALLIWQVDILKLLQFDANLVAILLCELVVFGMYLGLNYYRFFAYHHALSAYYHKLPQQMKTYFAQQQQQINAQPG